MPRLEKGDHAPLNVTQKAQHRVFAGLGWEPNAGPDPGPVEKILAALGLKKTWHDLDLSCLLFDKNRNIIDNVAGTYGKHIDHKGQIYHSGDNVAGIGEGDDEQISVELLSLDPVIHYILFVASIKSGHVFGEIDSPEIRLADGYSNHNFLQTGLALPEGRDKSAFVFACLVRASDGWTVHNVSTYTDAATVQKANGALSSLLPE